MADQAKWEGILAITPLYKRHLTISTMRLRPIQRRRMKVNNRTTLAVKILTIFLREILHFHLVGFQNLQNQILNLLAAKTINQLSIESGIRSSKTGS